LITAKLKRLAGNFIPTVAIVMGRRSKALLTCLHILAKAASRLYKATVKTAPDSDAGDADYIVIDDTCSVNDTCSDTEGGDGLNGMKGGFFALEDDLDSNSDLDSVNGSELEGMDLDVDEEVKIKMMLHCSHFLLYCNNPSRLLLLCKEEMGSEEKTQVLFQNSNHSLLRNASKWRKLDQKVMSIIKNFPPKKI